MQRALTQMPTLLGSEPQELKPPPRMPRGVEAPAAPGSVRGHTSFAEGKESSLACAPLPWDAAANLRKFHCRVLRERGARKA